MSKITWGVEIKTPNGRPDGLEDDELCFPCWGEDNWYCAESSAVDCVAGWANVTKIRLPANHRFYHKLKEDVVIDEILDNPEAWVCNMVAAMSEDQMQVELVRLIQAHEQHRKPVDPDIVAVREIMAGWYYHTTSFGEFFKNGEYDNDPSYKAALNAYKAAKS